MIGGIQYDRQSTERRRGMTNQEAIKYLRQLYPYGGHCWLDKQRTEAIGMAINALQEEPVSEDLKEAIDTYLATYFGGEKEKQEWPFLKKMAIYFAEWQKIKDESITEDLGEYINELSKQFPEVSFAKLSRIAVRVAKWQKEKMMANAVDGAFIRRNRYTKKNVLNGLDITCDVIQGFKDKDKIKVLFVKED